MTEYILSAYFAVISLISVAVCLYDKWASNHASRHRTGEATILALCALGGSVATFVTMLLIRHKTKHLKFMLGIPLIIVLQIILIIAAMHFRALTNFLA